MYREYAIEVQLVRESNPEPLPIKSASDLYENLKDDVKTWDRERFLVVCLNGAHEITGIHTASIGSVNSTQIHPREVFKPAILANAVSIIIAHNHPSGDLKPSSADDGVTEKMKKAAEIIGIKLLDHVILSSRGFFSYVEAGKL